VKKCVCVKERERMRERERERESEIKREWDREIVRERHINWNLQFR
jgi:hypothetical protein